MPSVSPSVPLLPSCSLIPQMLLRHLNGKWVREGGAARAADRPTLGSRLEHRTQVPTCASWACRRLAPSLPSVHWSRPVAKPGDRVGGGQGLVSQAAGPPPLPEQV